MSEPNDHVVYWEFTAAQYSALVDYIGEDGVVPPFRLYNGMYYLEQTPGNVAEYDMLFLDFDEFDGMPGGDAYGFGTRDWVPSQVPPVLRP